MENSTMTHAEAMDLKNFVHTEVERAASNMIKWVVGVAFASIAIITTVVGVFTAVVALA